MIKTVLTQLILVTLLGVPSNATNIETVSSAITEIVIKEPNLIHPVAKEYRKSSFKAAKEFLQFKLLGSVNTNITEAFKNALLDFNGPVVRITSLRRNWNSHSAHNHGNAVDFEFNHELIEWLTTNDGQVWLNKHNLLFYIEDIPGSAKLKPYKNDEKFRKFVFENPNATGDHVHIQIK